MSDECISDTSDGEYVPPSNKNPSYVQDIIYDQVGDVVSKPQNKISEMAKKIEQNLITSSQVKKSYSNMESEAQPLRDALSKISENDTNKNKDIVTSPINGDHTSLKNETKPSDLETTPPPLPERKHQNAPKGPGYYTHKPVPLPPKVELTKVMPMKIVEMKEYKGKSFKLQRFADTFLGQLPIVVNVCRGFYGQSELYTLSEDEKFAICFLADYKTMIGMESNGVAIEIPISDFYLMTILSDRKDYDSKQQESVQSIMNLNPTPKRVMALANFNVKNNIVEKGDILTTFSINYNRITGDPESIIFKDTQDNEIVIDGSSLEKFSLTLSVSGESFEKALPKCKFPQRASVYPKNRPTGLAAKYKQESNTSCIISEIICGKMFIAHVYEDKVTTRQNSRQGTLLEIPLDMDIEIEVLGKLEEKTYETKEELYSAYKHEPKRKIIRKDEEYQPISKVMPKKQTSVPPPESMANIAPYKKQRSESIPRNSTLEGSTVPKLPHKVKSEVSNESESNRKVDKLLTEEKQRNSDLNRMAKKLDVVVKNLESEVTNLKDRVDRKDQVIKELLSSRGLPPVPNQNSNPLGQQEENYNSIYDYQSMENPKFSPLKVPDAIYDESLMLNKRDLKTMSVKDVSDLLDALKMTKYVTKFEDEGINGEMLEEVDETILENDLEVTSLLHRKKLLKVISKLKNNEDISNYMTLDMLKKQMVLNVPPNVPTSSRPVMTNNNNNNTSAEQPKQEKIYMSL